MARTPLHHHLRLIYKYQQLYWKLPDGSPGRERALRLHNYHQALLWKRIWARAGRRKKVVDSAGGV